MIDNELFTDNKEIETKPINFATIDKIFNDGVTLVFDGEEEPTSKHYKVNSFAIFKPGDRVRIIKDSGTYVVEYSVGNPKTIFIADTATSTNNSINSNNVTTTINGTSISNILEYDGTTCKKATIANGVKNYNYNSNSNIQFYAQYSNELKFRLENGSWYTLALK